MSQALPLSRPANPGRRLLAQRLLLWLQRAWLARCAQAESPRRRVPYY